jgi:hypothetical protein
MAGDMQVIWDKWEWKYFCKGDWTPQIRLKPKEIFLPSCGACGGAQAPNLIAGGSFSMFYPL